MEKQFQKNLCEKCNKELDKEYVKIGGHIFCKDCFYNNLGCER